MATRNLSTDEAEAALIPEDILICILTRLDFRDIARSRCVCKRWKDITPQQQFLSSMMDGPQSLIIAGSWQTCYRQASVFPYPASIVRLETPPPQVVHNNNPDDASPPPPHVQLFQTNFSAHVPHLPQFPEWNTSWQFALPPASSSSPGGLYMLPDLVGSRHKPEDDGAFPGFISDPTTGFRQKPEIVGELPGFIFNLSTKKCKIIKPPRAPKYRRHVVTMGDHIYFMAQPRSYDAPDHPCFERYDTLSQSWEELEPLPPFDRGENDIIGTAVLDDTILFNIGYKNIWAYVVSRNKWYAVNDLDGCCDIKGEAVVLNNIIYALIGYCRSLVTLTLNSQENDGDLVFTCDLLKEYVVPGLGEMKFDFTYDDSYGCCTRLVHLGKDNFCAVFSCGFYYGRPADGRQYIQLTYMEVGEKKSIVTNICVHEFKIPLDNFLKISSCFSMPNCKSNALKEGTSLFNQEHEAEIVTLPPELVAVESNVPSKTISAAFSEPIPHSIDMSCHVYYLVLEDKLRKFGPVKNFLIDGHMSPPWAVDVEYESVTSKQNAIKASPITILGRTVVIEERGTSLIRGDSNRTSGSSSSGSNEVKNNGMDSRSKTTSGGYNATKATTFGDVVASGRSNTDEEGHSICVRNLPLDFSLIQLEKKLKKFGSVKDFLIHRDYSHMNESWVADVEFESTASKQNAIKASLITIGVRTVVIEEKRGTGLTPGDSNSGSSSSGSNEVKNHGKGSRSKTTSGGHNAPEATILGDVVASGRSNTDEEGHSICVRNLPPDFSLIQLEKRLKKFGPIKDFLIHRDYSHMNESWVADFEFESATSKQNAIKASPITIGGRAVVIEENRGTGFTLGDSNRTSGSSLSGSNEVKNHGKDSQSKTTSGGHNSGKKSRNQSRSKGGRK